MKNTPWYRRVLSVVLTVCMLCTLLVPAVSAEQSKAAEKVEELVLTPIERDKSGEKGVESLEPDTAKDDFAPTDVVRVSIQLDKASTISAGFSTENIAKNASAMAYRAGLRNDQAELTARIEKALGSKLDVVWNLTLAANIISANVQYGQIEAIKAVAGVKDVFLENRYEPMTTEKDEGDDPDNGSAAYMIGANITWANGYTGAGSKVAIIDTGADINHQSFDPEGLEYAWQQNAEAAGLSYDEYIAGLDILTQEKVAAVAEQLNSGASAAQSYVNAKIPYGYSYVDNDYDITHENDTQGGHGSHVAGIATANRFIKVDGEFQSALDAAGMQGVAPDAQLVVMKVFGNGGGAYDSDYMVAIEDAIVLGCDSANLSLGAGYSGSVFSAYQEIMDDLTQHGMVVAMSAGNSYSWYDTPYIDSMYGYLYADDVSFATNGTPGSLVNSLNVASVDNAGQTGKPLVFGDDLMVFFSETSGYGNEPIATLAGKTFEYVLLDNVGVDDNDHVGQEGDFFAALGSAVLQNKVALCYRGSSSFFAKANAAMAQGAAALIVINNQPGSISMNLSGYNYTKPCVSILQSSGEAIKAQSQAVEDGAGNVLYYTGTMSVSDSVQVQIPEISDTVTVSSFSSWGVPGSMVLKPEILAPGGGIYSVHGHNYEGGTEEGGEDTYVSWSGTSMASPQIAGMAALLGQYIRENDLCAKTGLSQRQLINSLLMSTAHPVFDDDGNYWPVLEVGAGLANVNDATSAKSYILMDEEATLFPDSAKDGKVKAELGDDPDYTGEYEYSFTIYPLEDGKKVAFRTDIFSQWLAGDGGYGMLQDYATMLLDSETSYEVNGQVYEDAFLLEADVNADGKTDAADAQAILDYIAGNLGEEETFDEAAADVDGDEKISTYDAKLILDSASSPEIEINGPTEVKVHIKVSEADKNYRLRYFTKGFYIQGYTYVQPVADEEGAMDVVHSIPILGYCGSWTDPSMLDRSSAIDDAYGTGKLPYLANANTNYMVVKDADGNSSIYMGNPYTVEDKFPADRLALNSEATIASFNFLNIRYIGTMGFAISDEEGNVLYSQAGGAKMAAYYYVNGSAWRNTSPSNYNVGKKLSVADVKEGDQITLGFYALPEYYSILNAKANGEVATSGTLDNSGFKAVLESGAVGSGAGIVYNVTIDDTEPTVLAAYRDLITGNISVKASDNAYIAYVGLTNKSGSIEYAGGVPEQSEPNETVLYDLDLSDAELPNEVVLVVGDYAGNEAAFKIELGGSSASSATVLGFVSENVTVEPGSGNRAWEIDVENLSYEYGYDDSYNAVYGPYTGLSVYAKLSFAVLAADYARGYVFMAADDGWFYGAPVEDLSDAARISRWDDKAVEIYDMAYNTNDKTMYVLDDANTLYTLDLVSGEFTPIYELGIEANIFNRLAIDDAGRFYTATSGGTSAELYKFELPEPVIDDSGEAPDNTILSWGFEDVAELDDWTLIDANNDGKLFERYTSEHHSGNACLTKTYNSTLAADDWAITPAVDLSDAISSSLVFWASNNSTSYHETFEIWVGESADPASMVKVYEGDEHENTWHEHEVDLSDYLDQEIYIGFRHTAAADQFRFFLDDVYICAEYDEEPEEPGEIELEVLEPSSVGSMGIWNYSNGGAFAWDHDNDILYAASNYDADYDYDHYLWKINVRTGAATRANSVAGTGSTSTNPSARLAGAVRGLLFVPGGEPGFDAVDEATELIVDEELLVMRGSTAKIEYAVLPWLVGDKEATFESADPAIATVDAKGVVTGVEEGETVITVTTNAEPHLTAEVNVSVIIPPAAEIRGIIWDESAKAWASAFNTNAPEDWEGVAEVPNFVWGVLAGDTYYGGTEDTMYAMDPDTYEVTNLGGISVDYTPVDGAYLPEELVALYAEQGYEVGNVVGWCYNGSLFELLNPEAGSLVYYEVNPDVPMTVLTYAGFTDFDEVGECALWYSMDENGDLYAMLIDMGLSLYTVPIASTGIDLSGVASLEIKASMIYDEENEYLYLAVFSEDEDTSLIYAIDPNTGSNGVTGNVRAKVYPVVGLYEYDAPTDLTLKVKPTSLSMFEGEEKPVSIKVILGETNAFEVESDNEDVAYYDSENGVVVAVGEGQCTLTVTTVDVNAAGEHLSEEIAVKVKGIFHLNASISAQVSDGNGNRIAEISLSDLSVDAEGTEVPFAAAAAGLAGDVYLVSNNSSVTAVDPYSGETSNFPVSSYFSTYPALDVANFPIFAGGSSGLNDSKALVPLDINWLVNLQEYSGWNLSSYITNLAAAALVGKSTMEIEDDYGSTSEADCYDYLLLSSDGKLYYMGIAYAEGIRSDVYEIADFGMSFSAQNALSMAYIEDYDEDAKASNYAGLVIADNGDKTLYYVDLLADELELDVFGKLDVDNVAGLIGTYDNIMDEDGTEPIPDNSNYYLVGSMTNWAPAQGFKLHATATEGLYQLTSVALHEGDMVKIKDADQAQDSGWYPDGTGNHFTVPADGDYKVEFYPMGTDDSSFHAGYFKLTEVIDPFKDTAYCWHFEKDPEAASDWTFVDADGDGYGWSWNKNAASWFDGISESQLVGFAYDGEGCLMSGSYINTVGVLTPDNWAISPAFDLSEATNATLTFYAQSHQDAYREKIIVYAGTDPENLTAISSSITLPEGYVQYRFNLNDYLGEEEVYVAIRNYGTTDQYLMELDLVEIELNGESEPEIPSLEDTPYGWYFESDPADSGWTFQDADSDGYNWSWTTQLKAHSGEGLLFSQSYANQTALTPDNWAISPAFDLSEAGSAYLSLWAVGQDPSYCEEIFKIYAKGSDDVDWTALSDDITAKDQYWNYCFDLADFLGDEAVQVAIRHYNVTDMFDLNIDDVEIILDEEMPEPAPEPVYVASYDFNTDPEEAGWQFLDEDGDNATFLWNATNGYIYDKWADDPDDWAVSPAIDLSGYNDAQLSLDVTVQSAGYPETISIYAGTSDDISGMTLIYGPETFTNAQSFDRIYVDLSDFDGENEVYVGIRHHDSPDMYYLYLDNFQVRATPEIVEEGAAPVLRFSNLRPSGNVDVTFAQAASSVDAESSVLARSFGVKSLNDGSLNAVKGELSFSELRKPIDETALEDGTVQIVLSEDVAVTNGLYIVTYNADRLTFVDAASSIGCKSIRHYIDEPAEGEPQLRTGNIVFAFASEDELAAESALLTLNFSYDAETIYTTVVVTALERNDDVAVNEDSLVIEVSNLPDEIYEQVEVVEDGQQIVIYNPAYGKAVSNEGVNENFRAGVDVEPVDNQIINPDASIVWTVQYAEDGVYLVDAEGHKLSCSGNNLVLDAEYDLWAINDHSEETPYKLFVNVNAPAGAQSGDPRALEWYAAKNDFSCYYLNADDDQFQFLMFAKVEGSDEHICPCANFEDMPEYGTPEHEAIDWAYTVGVTAGVDATHFGTENIVTRGQAMVFLWAAKGRPEHTLTSSPFSDVKKKHYFYDAVLWAYENGYASGTGNGKFSPNETCSRAAIVQFIYAAMGKPEYTISNPYSDVKNKHWYKDAAIWAYEAGLECGENGKFNANTPCTRASVVLYLYRYMTGNCLDE